MSTGKKEGKTQTPFDGKLLDEDINPGVSQEIFLVLVKSCIFKRSYIKKPPVLSELKVGVSLGNKGPPAIGS